MSTTFRILGEQIAMPVHIRDAEVYAAMFPVPAARAQSVIDYSGLSVLPYRPGRTVCALMFIEYHDGDLHRYREFGIGFLVHAEAGGGPAGALGDLRALLTGGAGAFVHRLPVTEEFTCAAGRTIWGFPKELSRIDLARSSSGARGVVRIDDRLVADVRFARGVPVPGAGAASSDIDVYSHMDGVTRRIPWTLSATGARMRPGGADAVLGPHPWGEELRALGLPRRALLSTGIAHARMRFDEAEVVGRESDAATSAGPAGPVDGAAVDGEARA
ncbi:acetoacetate decarboxylase family protein [Tomitella cavernea]|uniref:Acetoacetate decarboxylase family protein n=1 Tax=Tomitella cavernea TaxID=1387982 RepID=A0ABP9C0S8_9ACTN|nr:acetoacetate decarboxylase family protein [Tomitella cavernea]